MSKEEFLKIQTCVLKVNIHCDGCKQKVKKILQKIDGVYTTEIDSEQGKVIISGNVDPATLIKKLTKNGKHAEIWGASKPNNNNANQLHNQFKNLQTENGKGGNYKGQEQKDGGNNQLRGGGGGAQGQNPQLQQLEQLKQMKGFQEFMKDMKMPLNNIPNQKPMKLKLPEDEGLSDDEFDDYDDDDDYYDDDEDDDLDDDLYDTPLNKMKPVMGNGNGGSQMTNVLMNSMMNGQLSKGAANGGNNGGNGKKGGSGGGGNVPVQMNLGGGGNDGKGGANGGKKCGNGNNNFGNQNQGGGESGKNGGGQPQDVKTGGGNGGQNKNGNHGNGGGGAANIYNFMANGAKKGGGTNDGPRDLPNMMSKNAGGSGGHMGNMPIGPMSNSPMSQMSNLAAVKGLPAMNGGGSHGAGAGAGAGAGYFQGAGPDHLAGNPFYQQQMAALMMNQQRASGNERFQPVMYARPPSTVNYMPPYPSYPYYPPQDERAYQYSMFSDENASSCTMM